jgi:hypothetical protein
MDAPAAARRAESLGGVVQSTGAAITPATRALQAGKQGQFAADSSNDVRKALVDGRDTTTTAAAAHSFAEQPFEQR